ncbi:hypothetical protein [Paractinoplanes toevensis]|uniref:Membrane-associated oxidoreductase n=1 Tax=Paractinoplanes toevensis TaxID=571911 RepID=A0A919W7J3_9ACTN|nr:hypothetical protein [Actinoplanes toevensis]GIM95313.1 hypothetical protein Ato02nite_071060 [Actinoplanes toevensis]
MTAGDSTLFRELVAASRDGTVVDGPRVIGAATLRRAVLQPPGPEDHPTGQLHLQGITIDGDLDLRGSTLGVQLTLIECVVRGGLNLLEASLPGLQLDRTTAAWVDAANCVITLEVWLKESSFRSGIDFTDARVGGSVHLDGSTFGPEDRTDAISVVPRGCPVRMRRLTIGGMLSAPRIDCQGMFDLANSRIGGDLELDSSRLAAPGAEGPVPGTALNGPELRVGGSLSADRRHERARRSIVHGEVNARPVGSDRTTGDLLDVTGRLYLPGVVIGGIVDLSAGRLTAVEPEPGLRRPAGPSGDAEFDPAALIVLDRAEVRGNVELDAGFTARGSVRLSGAEIGGDLRFDRSSLGRPDEAYAVVANGVVVRGHVTAADADVAGEICLQDARIQHSVLLQRATLANPGGNALNLHRARVGGTIDCGEVTARGSLRLADVTAGSVFVSGARLSAPCRTDQHIFRPGARGFDPVLNLIGAEITGTVRGNPAGRPFTAEGVVGLRGARISRSVQFIQAEIDSGEGPALDASTTSCSDLYLGGLDAVGGVRLTDARIAGDVDLTGSYLRWNEMAVETLRTAGRPEASVDGGAAEIGGDIWFDGARAEGMVRLRRAVVRRSVGLKDVVLGALAVHRSASAPGDVAATRDRALMIAAARADAAEAAVASGLEAARAVAEQARRDASPAAIDAARNARPPVPEQRRRRRRSADPPDPGLLVLDLAGLRTPDLVVAPGQPLRGNVDMSRAVVISFTDNANLWQATHLDLHGLEYQVHIDLDARPGTADWHTQIRRFESTKILPPPSTLRTDVALPTGQLSQPYLQLAAIYRATGADSVARRILYEMRKREWAQRISEARRARRWSLAVAGFLYRITVGYGYRLQLALYWLAGLWLAGFLVFGLLAPAERPDPMPVVDARGNTSECVVRPAADPVADQPGYCGRFSPGLYTMDLLVPVVDLGQKSSWHYRSETMQIVADVLQVAGWILATAAATAALGLVGRGDT